MINLMPAELKEQMVYGRRNRMLLRWCIASIIGIVGMGGIVLFGQVYIDNSEKNLQANVATINERIVREKLPESQKEYEALASGVKTVVQILSKQLLFSQLVPQIGTALPEGAVLTGLTLTPEDVAIDLQVAAKDESIAAQTQVNFSDPRNQLFDKADIVSLSCSQPSTTTTPTTTTPATSSAYPCSVNLKVLYKKDANFLFLNSLGAAR